MKYFAVYDPVTGVILQSVNAPDLAGVNVGAGLLALEVDSMVRDDLFYVSGSGLVAYPTRPNAFDQWSGTAWIDSRDLNSVKLTRNGMINSARLAANQSTFTFLGKLIACDELSRSDIDAVSGLVALTGVLPPGFPGGWKAIDNTYVAIPDKATWVSFYAAMVAQGVTNFNHAQTLKATLVAALTITEAEAITW